MAKVDELVVEVKAEASDFIRTIDNISDRIKDFSYSGANQIKGLSSSFSSAAKGLAVFSLAIEGAQKILATFKAALDVIAEGATLKRLSDRIGLTTQEIQKLGYTARLSGIEQEVFVDAIKDLNVKITDASRGAKAYEDALNAVGLTSSELVKLSPHEQFLKFADALNAASDNASAFAADEINDSMYKMLPAIRGGTQSFAEQGEELQKLGVILRDDQISAMNDATIAVEKASTAFGGMATQLGSYVSPWVTDIANKMSELAGAVNRVIASLSEPDEAVTGIKALDLEIEKLEEKISSLIEQSGPVDEFMRVFGGASSASDEVKKLTEELDNLKAKRDSLDLARWEKEWKKAFGAGSEEGASSPTNQGIMWGFGDSQGVDSGATQSSEVERIEKEQEDQLLAIEESLARKTILEEEYRAEKILAEQAMQDAILESQQRASILAAQYVEDEENRKRKAKERAIDEAWKAQKKLAALTNSENRKMFEVGKAARKAEVLIETPKAAMSAYSAMVGIPYVGPILGAAAAAAAIAYGAQQLQQIESTSFRGGGGGGGSAPQTPDLSASAGDIGSSSTQTTNFDVTLVGDSFGAEQVRGLIGAINEQTGDNVKLNAVMAG